MKKFQTRKIVVVGNGMVGHHFVSQLAAQAPKALFETTVLCGEPRLAYDRVHLSEFFTGKTANDLALVQPSEYDEWGVQYCLNMIVSEIDRSSKCVKTVCGERFAYDQLVLATGSYPFVPPIPGGDQAGCFVYRTIEDLENTQAWATDCQLGVVIGGGLLGLEAANALKNLGLETHVVEFAPQLMPAQLDEGGGAMLRAKIEALGVQVHTDRATQEIQKGVDHRLALHFADGKRLETDIVVFSAGIRPQDALAKTCDLARGARGGFAIDVHCRTQDPDIFAIGECAALDDKIFGLVAPGYRMAETVVSQLLLKDGVFQGADMSTRLKLLGVEVGAIGDGHGRTPGALSYTYVNQKTQIYKRMVVDESGTKLLGAVLVGDTQSYDTLLQYCLNDLNLPDQPEALIMSGLDADACQLSPDALPDTAVVCSCHNVTRGAIVAAVTGGCCSLADVKCETKASTGCGGCGPLLKTLVDTELAKQGVEINNDICPHFAYTRQSLFHLIQVQKIKTFEALLLGYGRGSGCDICKPAVASILASLWNEHVLEPSHVGLQDTNDAFLANIQRDGTYSVVPRVPAGEIRPEQLIALGEIAKKYKLYTKITGGQRVDLFGARKDDLPEIWEALIQAGMETGHAYGKAVRTVKSCVGSTWCRYGVQDSVGMAILLENRYKGLRSPHKLKLAVSGCTRECAEAQSKDVGVIATDRGWNLYVCGNGGMKPRHAELFATDLDDETLIRTVDRFLMFYVRTADRLQRTSVWREKLEGGLDYLKAVILEDSLGLAESLEQQMLDIVDTYQCEWKTVVNDPEKRARFSSFVNSSDKDNSLEYIKERGQWRPAKLSERTENPVVGSRTLISQTAVTDASASARAWTVVCSEKELVPNAGVCALINGEQVALFYVPKSPQKVFAIHNWDPVGQANVLSRGIVGDIDGELVVASPLYKQHFSLRTGKCFEEPTSVAVYEAQLEGGEVAILA